jgi:hypothetical protein
MYPPEMNSHTATADPRARSPAEQLTELLNRITSPVED